jgi:hypothetical protein
MRKGEVTLVQRKTNLMHNLFLVHSVNLYMFRAYLGPSSGGTTVCMQHLVLIILFRWLTVVLVGLEQSAILVVPTVKGRMEAQLSISPLSLQALLQDTFTFTFTAVLMIIQVFWDVTPCRLANVYQSTLYNLEWYFSHKTFYLLQVYGNGGRKYKRWMGRIFKKVSTIWQWLSYWSRQENCEHSDKIYPWDNQIINYLSYECKPAALSLQEPVWSLCRKKEVLFVAHSQGIFLA